ncbi:MAG: aldehyde dehydrogenase family protein [Steroidobacteraceae bacterium]
MATSLQHPPATSAFSGEHFAVRNPRDGQVDYHFTAPSRSELEDIAAGLRRAQVAWREASLQHRIDVLRRWREEFAKRQGEIAAALAVDTGRYLIATAEAGSVLGMIDRWTALVPKLAQEEAFPSAQQPTISYCSQYVPYSLVGVISPWNFPVSLCFIDAIPALLAGCAVLVKPSEVTPRFVEPARRAIEAVPELAAVFQIHPGGREAGESLVALSDVVCFTGSVATGRRVAENAASHFIPAFLELGGNDPMIVTASADLERATDVALRATCLATGQACQSLERIYVHRSLYDRFVARLVEKAAKVEPNWPDIHAGTIGPFIFGKQAETVAAQLADARAKGARILTGGEIEDHGGKWLRPTVVVDVDHSMQLMVEETFGPVIPVMPFDTIDEALALANEGAYGLSAAVFAGTLEEAEAIGRRIDAGGISLNDGSLTANCHEAEKHSFKLSGMGGSRMGPAGYLRFFRRKVLIRQSGAPPTIESIAERNARPA